MLEIWKTHNLLNNDFQDIIICYCKLFGCIAKGSINVTWIICAILDVTCRTLLNVAEGEHLEYRNSLSGFARGLQRSDVASKAVQGGSQLNFSWLIFWHHAVNEKDIENSVMLTITRSCLCVCVRVRWSHVMRAIHNGKISAGLTSRRTF